MYQKLVKKLVKSQGRIKCFSMMELSGKLWVFFCPKFRAELGGKLDRNSRVKLL